MPINGFIKTTSPTKHALLIKPMAMIMELDAQLKLSARAVFQEGDAGLKRTPKFTELTNTDRSREKKT